MSASQSTKPDAYSRLRARKCSKLSILMSPSGIATPTAGESSRYTPDTAFIMMQIDKGKPELDDVLDTVAGGVRPVRYQSQTR